MMILHIIVKPKSRCNELTVNKEGNILVKIKAPPHDGEANKYLIEFLSDLFNIPKSAIQLIKGHTNTHKKISISSNENYIHEILKQKTIL